MQWASHCLENHSRQTQRTQLRWLHWCHSDQCPRVTGATERKNTWKNEGTAKLGLVFWRPTGGSLFFGITFFNLFIICFPTIVDSFYILLGIIKYIYIYILYNPFEYLWIDFSVLNRGVIGILRCRAGQGAWSWRTPWPPQGSQSSWRWAASKEREAKPYMVSRCLSNKPAKTADSLQEWHNPRGGLAFSAKAAIQVNKLQVFQLQGLPERTSYQQTISKTQGHSGICTGHRKPKRDMGSTSVLPLKMAKLHIQMSSNWLDALEGQLHTWPDQAQRHGTAWIPSVETMPATQYIMAHWEFIFIRYHTSIIPTRNCHCL